MEYHEPTSNTASYLLDHQHAMSPYDFDYNFPVTPITTNESRQLDFETEIGSYVVIY